MKISLKRVRTIRKTVITVLIMGLFMAQTNVASAIVLNCDQVDPENLTADQKIFFNSGGTFEPVSTYASQIKARFEEVAKAKKEIYESTHPSDEPTDEAFCPELDVPTASFFGKCPEIEGYTDVATQKKEGFYSQYRNEFAKKIEETFQNKASNSSLVPLALQYFNEYSRKQDMLCGIFHHYLFSNVESDFSDKNLKCQTTIQTDVNEHYSQCKKALEDAVEESNSIMLSHIKSTAAEKKATLLVEKYKAVNKKLRDLNNSVARMYAFFQTFANKLLFKADKQMVGM